MDAVAPPRSDFAVSADKGDIVPLLGVVIWVDAVAPPPSEFAVSADGGDGIPLLELVICVDAVAPPPSEFVVSADKVRVGIVPPSDLVVCENAA